MSAWQLREYNKETELCKGIARALRQAKHKGESEYIEVWENIAEIEEETDEYMMHLYKDVIPSVLGEYLDLLNLACSIYHFTGVPGQMYEYAAVCTHKMSGSTYTVYFDIDYDREIGVVRVVGVEAVAGAHKPGPYYEQVA